MTSKLYAESAPRGFKAYQVEIPVAKVLNRIKEHGKQKVSSIEAVAKADKERNRAWLESKLHADKVTLDNIRENYRFSEKNKARIAKAEQKELDDRVKSAQIEYNQNARRPPDKSLLEKLGPALAKAVPAIVGAVQAHQAGIDAAATEAAQEMMWKLDITSAEYNDMLGQANSLRGDTVALEAYYESLIGQFSDKTGHVFTRDDFVRLLEDGSGAYSIAAQGVAAVNGMSAYEQNMKMWELENKRKYNDPVLYQQALEEQSIVARDAAFGKDYFNSELSHYVKFTKIKPEFDKVIDGMLSRHHTYLDREAEYTHGLKESSNYTVFAAENDYASWGQHIEGRVVIRGGDRNVAYTEMFDTLDNLAKAGQLDLQDVNWLMKYGRDSSGNQALGTPGNSNLYSQRVDRLRNLVLNQAHQTNNIIEQQKALGVKNLRQQVQTQLATEPSAAAALKIRDQIMNTHEWNGMTHEQQNQFHKLWNPLLKHPKSDVRTFEQIIEAPGANSLRKNLSKELLESSFKDETGLALNSLASAPINQGLVQSELESILERQFFKARAEGPSKWRDDTQGNLSDIFDKALQETKRIADDRGLLKADKDPQDPSEYVFTKYGKPKTYVPESESARMTKYQTHKDDTDKIFLAGQREMGLFNDAAYGFEETIRVGGEITRQDIMKVAGRMGYLRDLNKVTGIPVSELFANQLKVLHPNITIPNSAITTQEEIRGAEQVINKTLLDMQSGRLGVSTDVSGFYQDDGMPALNPEVQRTSFTPVSGQVTGYSRYNPPAGRLRGMQGARLKLTDEDWYYIANAVQGEAGPDDDMFYVAANIATRMAMPGAYGSTAKQVVTPAGQYVGYAPGKTINQNLMNRLRSPEGQAKIAEAMKHLDGRESFKGRDLYHNMGEGDIRPNDRSNYYHYAAQGAGKHIKYNPAMAHDHWKRLVIFNDDTYGTGMQSNPPHYTENKRWF